LLQENIENMGTLGNAGEPLLDAAITRIIGAGRLPQNPKKAQRSVRDNRTIQQLKTGMYRAIPEGFSDIK
jgi:hypothetical protein